MDETELSDTPSPADVSGGGDLDDTTAPGTKKPSARYLRNMHDFLGAGHDMVDEEGEDQENEDVKAHMDNMKSMFKDGMSMCSDLHNQIHGTPLGEEEKSGTGGSHEPEGQTTTEQGPDQIEGLNRRPEETRRTAAKPPVTRKSAVATEPPARSWGTTRKSASDFRYEQKLRTLDREEVLLSQAVEAFANQTTG
jgi:hypothetical protein